MDGGTVLEHLAGELEDSVHVGERIGVVDAVDDRSANILFTLHTAEGRELMIPVHPELIHDYDAKRRELVVEIPDGLLDLN